MSGTIAPEGEALRMAVRWIGRLGLHQPHEVKETARRFDLSPLEEDFLLKNFAEAERKTEDSELQGD